MAVYLFDDWFDPIEAGLRDRVREFIQAMVEGELDAALIRPRYSWRSQSSSCDADGPVGVTGHRHAIVHVRYGALFCAKVRDCARAHSSAGRAPLATTPRQRMETGLLCIGERGRL